MSVLIEFTEATAKRAKGERVHVDEGSAVSLVKRKKVARVITEAMLKAEAKKAAGSDVAEDLDDDLTGDSGDDTAEQSAPAGGAG